MPYVVEDGEVVAQHVGHPPAPAEVVHSHRPSDELPMIVELARQVGACAVCGARRGA